MDTETTTFLRQDILRLSVLEMAYAKIVILGSSEADDDESYARIGGEIRKGDEGIGPWGRLDLSASE